MTDKPNVIVYSSTNCHYCGQLKKYLNEQHVVYEERNIDLNETFAEELWNTGMRSVPVTVVGDKKILGMNLTQLNKALGLSS
ncbi:glutaredoxin family protein [Paenibacillus filicis]|uniref:Glutaredoxin family protein n=1 Tax=Paenibacillus gyeongsangnamensis TaxID=3388067 RepID=A0ABT4QIM7_9BACL|nr:glutaredoxin family protein [Paenibacillus filicis]MCZ8516703.1 glutaredoxin family protein [Paenibacillus filicis]